MFDKDELEDVREGARGFVDRDVSDDAEGRTSRNLFAKSLASSVVVLVALLFLTFTGMAVPATFGNVGGVFVEIGEIRGNDVSIYPAVGESAACEWSPRVDDPSDPTDRALPTVSADLGQAHIPSPYALRFTKDIRLPEQLVHDKDLRISMQRDPEMIPGDVNTTPYQDPPGHEFPIFTGQFIRNFNLDSDADIPNVDGLRESTAVDDSSGTRDLTDRKIYLVEGEDYSFDLTLRLIDETSINPEFQVEPAGVAAFIDWDNAGVEDEGEFVSGDQIPIGNAPATEDGLADVSESFTVPTGVVPSGEFQAETLMRVVMEVDEDASNIQPGGQIEAGVTEEYTVVVVENADDIPARTEIGDINMKTSGLQADFLDLRADEATSSSFLLDDRYSDPGSGDDPVFTSDGEFIIEAETALDDDENTRITDVTAQIHHAAFSRLSLSQLQLDIGFVNSTEARVAEGDCPVLTPGFIPEITHAPFNVQPGEEFNVNGTITNPGDEVENQTLQLEFPEGDVDWEYTDADGDRTELEVAGGETVHFDGTDEPPFDAQAPSETGRFDVVLRPGADEPTSQEVIVGDPPEFLIDIDEPTTGPDPVVATEEGLTVNYSITNAGDVVGEQDIDLFFNGTDYDTIQVSQDTESVEGATTTHDPSFDIIPSDSHAGDPVNITVASEDDSDSVDVTILESPTFEVNITRAGNVTNPNSTFYDEEKWIYGEPIDARVDSRSGEHNESLGVEVNVTNTGDATDTQDVELDVTNSLGTTHENVDNLTDLTLTGGESEVFNLTFQPEPDRDVPEIDATVRSEDTADTVRGLNVTGEGAIYQILNLRLLDEDGNEVDGDDSLPPGDEITAEFDVRNVGNEEGEQDIFLDILPDSDVPMGQPGNDTTYGTPNGSTYGMEEFSTSDPGGYEQPFGDDDSLFIDAARLREDPHREVDWDELQVGFISTGSGLDATVYAVDDGTVVDSTTVTDVSSSTNYDISGLQSSSDVAVEFEGTSDDPESTWSIDEDDVSVTYTVDGEPDSIDVPKGAGSSLLRDWSTLGALYRTSHEHDRDDVLGLGYVDPHETSSETQFGADGTGFRVELYWRLDDLLDQGAGFGDDTYSTPDFTRYDRPGDVRDDANIDESFSGVFGSGAFEFYGNDADEDARIAAPTALTEMGSSGDSARATSVWVKGGGDGSGGGDKDEAYGGVFHGGDSRSAGCGWTLRQDGSATEWAADLGIDESGVEDGDRDGWSAQWTMDATDEWRHVVMTYNGDDAFRVYVDGSHETGFNMEDFSLCTDDRVNFRVGEFYLHRGMYVSDDRLNFRGEVDEVMHFDSHLSSNDVEDLYLDGRWGDFEGRWEGDDRAAAPMVDHVSWNDGGYGDFTGLDDAYPASGDSFGNVSRHQDYTIEIDGSGWTQYNYAFFDWTQTGDFEQEEDGSHYVGYTSSSTLSSASTSITVPDHAEAGQTRMRVISNDDNLEDPAPDSYDGEAEDYAVFVEPDEGPEYIDAVRMGDIDLTSGDDDGYANFTDTANSTRIFRGEDVEVEVDVMAGVRDTQVYVWVDWDRSGDFTPGEDVMIGETDGEPGTVSDTVSVPFGAELGETRMRVMARSDAAGDVDDPPNPNPADGYLGETEDYAVVIDDPAGIKEGVDVNESVVLEPVEVIENMTLEYTLEDEDAPGIEAQVRTDHDTESQSLGVTQSAVFDIIESDLTTNQPITTDETLFVDFPVENIGDLTGDVEVHLDVDQEQDGDYGEGDVEPVSADASVYPTADGDSDSFDEYINAFEFESDDPEDDIDVLSGNDGGYGDYTDEIAVVAPGQTYDITVEYTGPQEGWEGQVAAWIDSEHTEDFDQTGDLVFDQYQDGDGDGIYEGTVEIPSDIETGATVMRVIGTFDDSPPDPNDFIDDPGEAEDYTIYVPSAEGESVDADLWPDGTGSDGDEHLTNVAMGDEIDRSSGDDAYYDFTDDILTVEQDEEFEIAIDFDDADFDDHYGNVFIDWDQNEDWSTAQETEVFAGVDDDTQTYTENINVPSDAEDGCTLARVRLGWGGFDDAGDTGTLGEVNDFTVCVGEPEISVDSDTATIDGGDTHDFTLEYEPADTDPPEVNIRVRAINLVRDALDDTAFRNNVQIDEPADFQIVDVTVNDPVLEVAGTLEYDVTIENQGGVQDSQEVTLDIDGEQVDERPITLDPGDDTSVTLEYQTKVDDASSVSYEVATEDDTDTGTSSVDGYWEFTREDFGTDSTESHDKLVTDFEWDYPACDGSTDVYDLDIYFGPDDRIGDDEDEEFGIRDIDGLDDSRNVPGNDCGLRANMEDFSVIYSDPGDTLSSDQQRNIQYYPERGESFTFGSYVNARDSEPRLQFLQEDNDNFYMWRFGDTRDGEIQLWTQEDGDFTMLDSAEVDYDSGEFYEIEVETFSTGIRINFDGDFSTVSDFSDAAEVHDGRGIAFGLRSGDDGMYTSSRAHMWDEVRVEDTGCNMDRASYVDSGPGDTDGRLVFEATSGESPPGHECALGSDGTDGAYVTSNPPGLDGGHSGGTPGGLNEPDRGDRIRFWAHNFNEWSDGWDQFMFGVQDNYYWSDPSDYYAVGISYTDDEVAFIKDGDGADPVHVEDMTISEEGWYEVVVDWGMGDSNGGEIYVAVLDEDGDIVGDFEVFDGDYDDGAIGYMNGNSGLSDPHWGLIRSGGPE